MKKIIIRSLAFVLTGIILISIIPISALGLTVKEQEDFYRVNTKWQDEYNSQYIDWLLESDNFLYHLDMESGNIIQDHTYAAFNLNPKTRMENFVEILSSFIGLSFEKTRETNYSKLLCELTSEFLSGFKDMISTSELPVEDVKCVVEAINETSDYYLNYVHGVDTSTDDHNYEVIYQRLESIFDDGIAVFDNRTEVKEEFYRFVKSDEWLLSMKKKAEILSVGDCISVAQKSIGLACELESYRETDEQLISFLKYVKWYTSDSALRAACDLIISKFENSYFENIASGIAQMAVEKTFDLAFDKVKDAILNKCGIIALFAQIGIEAGKSVSDIWFNTSEMKKHMQTSYCLNAISEILVPLIKEERQEMTNAKYNSSNYATCAANYMYHMKLLIHTRRLGEENYYNLKDSSYSSSVAQACITLGAKKWEESAQIIEEWYKEFTNAINGVEASLFAMIPTEYYIEKKTDEYPDYVFENDKLIKYQGSSSAVYLPSYSSFSSKYHTIAENAFKNADKIKSVTIPAHVQTIETYAFNNCPNLESITIDNSEIEIEENAFYGCNENLILRGWAGSTVEQYAIANGLNFVAFETFYEDGQNQTDSDFVIEDGVLVEYNGNYYDEIFIPYGVTEIGKNVFSGAANNRPHLYSIYIPETVIKIGAYAFSYCDISNITIFDSCSDINNFAFNECNISNLYIGEGSKSLTHAIFPNVGCDNLYIPKSINEIENTLGLCISATNWGNGVKKEISVDEHNEIYSSIDGILYNKKQSILLYCPNRKSTIISIPETVTKISEYAFSRCKIDTLEIPKTVTDIEYEAFFWTNIGSLKFNCNLPIDTLADENNYGTITKPIFDHVSIGSFIIGDSVTIIPNFLFYDEKNTIENIVLGSNLTNIGKCAFSDCSTENQMESITIPEEIVDIGYHAFYNLNVKTIYYNAISTENKFKYFNSFSGCSVENIVFGNKVKEIPNYLFVGCGKLSKIQFGESVEKIGIGAFAGCSTIKKIDLPKSVVSIGERAFSGCENLTTIEIPENVTALGSYIIEDCTNMKKVIYNAKNATGARPFFSNSVTELVIGENVKSLDYAVFADMSVLEKIIFNTLDINSNLSYAFDFYDDQICTIQHLVIGKNVSSVSDSLEYDNDLLSSVSILEYNAINFSNWLYFPDENVEEIIIGAEVETLPYDIPQFIMNENITKLSVLSKDGRCEKWLNGYYWMLDNCPNLKVYSYPSNTYLVEICNRYNIPFIPLCEHDNLSSFEVKIIEFSNCISKGLEEYTCPSCNYTFQKELPLSEHTFKDWTIDTPATCTTVGSKSHHCTVCGEKTDITEIPASHSWSTDWTVDIPATCTTVGSKSHHCTVCGEKTDITEIPISHTWEENYTVDIEPTETTEGSQSIHCTKCDAKTNVTVIPKLVEESPQEDFEYSIRSGKVTINGYKGTSLIVSIPTYIDGYPVTSISSFVFHNNTTITKVVIPYTVTDLGNYAFYNCSNLAEITLGSGLRTIAKSCFYNCKSLKTVVLPESITSIQDRAFYCCENLTDIELSNNITSIGELTFYRCSSLSSINFGKNISSVGNDAFYKTIWFNNLVGECLIMGDGILMKFENEFGEDVIIPEGVKSIYSDAIETSYVSTVYLPSTLTDFNNSALNIDAKLFIVDSDNPYLCTIDGVIYSKDKTYLKAVPSKKTGTLVLPDTVLYIETSAFKSSYLENVVLNNGLLEIGEKAFYFSKAKVNIPKTVTKIGSNAFCYNTVITEIVIPDGVETIESWTFSGCSSLKKITLPTGLSKIGSYAFDGCSNLTTIIYNGDLMQLAMVNISTSGNTAFDNAKIIYLGDFKFKGASLSLHHNLAINYKADKALFDEVGYENPYVVFELNGVKTTVRNYTVDGNRYVFTFNNIAPNQMNDTIYATLYATYDGVVYESETKEYSVAEYCYGMLSNYSTDEYAKLRTLLVDLLHYGAQSQLYTDYNADNLVDSKLTETQLAWGTVNDPVLTNSLNTTYETVDEPIAVWKGAGLTLKDSITMRFKFKTDSVDGLTVKIKTETDEWNITADKFVKSGDAYYVYFNALNASQMSEKVYLTVYSGNKAVSNTVCYSIESYAYEKQSSSTEYVADLVKAMMKYGNSAYNYVN